MKARIRWSALAAICLAAHSISAGYNNWINPGTGDALDLSNWSTGTLDATTTATVANGGTAVLSGGNLLLSAFRFGQNDTPGSTSHYIQTGGSYTGVLAFDYASTGEISGGTIQATGLSLGGLATQNATVLQTGGVISTTTCTVGASSSEWCGEYTLQAGTLNVGSYMIVGAAGAATATFGQSGGSNTAARISLANIYNTTGSYRMSGGSLQADLLEIADITGSNPLFLPRQALYEQTGGQSTLGVVQLFNKGTLKFTGGTMDVTSSLYNGGGTLDFGGASVTLNASGYVDISSGTIANASHATLNIGSNSILNLPVGYDPSTVFANYTNAGITKFAGEDLVIPSGTIFKTDAIINDHTVVEGTVLIPHNATFHFTKGLEVRPGGIVDLRDPNAAAGFSGTQRVFVNDLNSGNSGGTLTVDWLNIGSTSSGRFVQTGGTTTCRLSIGAAAGSAGTFEMQAGTLTTTNLAVGSFGTGAFIQTGGYVRSTDLSLAADLGTTGRYSLSNGTIYCPATKAGNITYPAWFRVGSQGIGTMTQSGGLVVIDGITWLGYSADSDPNTGVLIPNSRPGFYTLSGGTLQTQTLLVGHDSSGTFLQSGGTVSVGSLSVGRQLSGTGTTSEGRYLLSNGTLVANRIAIGSLAFGTFTQTGGSVSASGTFSVGGVNGGWPIKAYYDLQGGTLDVNVGTFVGTNSATLRQGNAYLRAQRLTLKTNSSYFFNGNGTLEVGRNLNGTGSINFSNLPAHFTLSAGASAFLVNATLANASQVSFDAGAGSFIEFPAGFDPNTAYASFHSDGIVHFAGDSLTVGTGQGIGGSGTITGNTNNGGNVGPGSSPGTLRIVGNYTQTPQGKLEIELGGTTAGLFDVLSISGTGSFAGTLEVKKYDTFVPVPTNSFRIISFGSGSGSVSILNSTGLPGLKFSTNWTSSGVDLNVSGTGGDADLNGKVNTLDFNILVANFGYRNDANWPSWLMGNFTGNQVIDSSDFDVLVANYGKSLPAASLGAIVPEPISSGAAVVLVLLAAGRRRRLIAQTAPPALSGC